MYLTYDIDNFVLIVCMNVRRLHSIKCVLLHTHTYICVCVCKDGNGQRKVIPFLGVIHEKAIQQTNTRLGQPRE